MGSWDGRSGGISGHSHTVPETSPIFESAEPQSATEDTLMTEHRGTPLRVDAQQNRERILDAARAALTASGDASLNAITKRAGVGPGTLYRHFPTREALVLAVYHQDVQLLVDAAPVLLQQHPPLVALRLWCDRLADTGQLKHGLADVLATTREDEHAAPVMGAIALLLQAGQRAGSVRPDLDPYDVLLLVGFLWRLDPGPGWRARSGRLLDVVMDGLRVPPPAEP